MNYLKLFEQFDNWLKETISDIFIDWIDFNIHVVENETSKNKHNLYIFIIAPNNKQYFTLNENMKSDIIKCIDLVSYQKNKLDKLLFMPSIFYNNMDEHKSKLIKFPSMDKYEKSNFIHKILVEKNVEEIVIDENEKFYFDDNLEISNKIAIGYILLIFEKNQ